MKNIFIALLLLSLSSCNIMKIFGNQEIHILEKCTPIVFDNKMPLVSVKLDSVGNKFLLDTGATGSIIVDSSEIKNFQNKKFYYFGSAIGADKKALKRRLFTANIDSDVFIGENKVFAFFELPKQECSKQKFSGIMGMDLLLDENFLLFLNFSNNQLCNISKESQNNLLKAENFQQIKSECKKNMIYIFLVIENVEYKFKLDTGFIGELLIPKSKDKEFKNQDFRTLEGSMFATLTSTTVGNELIYDNMPIGFGILKFESPVIISSTIASQNAGINFIKRFDWIINYEKNEVYIKPNSNFQLPVEKKHTQYSVVANNSSLFIKLKEKSQAKYHLGDKIISVNSKKVTPENICDLQDFLNKTEDWNTLDLEVIQK